MRPRPVLQDDRNSCGVAALVWALRSLGTRVGYRRMKDLLAPNRKPEGVLPWTVIRIVRNFGHGVRFVLPGVLGRIASSKTGVCLCAYNGRDVGPHWVAISGDYEKRFVMDPLSPKFIDAEDHESMTGESWSLHIGLE